MDTLPITTNSTAATQTLLETFRSANTSLSSTSLRNEVTRSNAPLQDTLTLSKAATQPHNLSNDRARIYSQNFFTSYVDLLQQQQKTQAMIEQDLSGTTDTPNLRTSVLNRYQTLQYRQNLSDRVFSLKGDIFQGMLNAIG